MLPGNRRFSRALKVVTWQQPACCPSLIPLSSLPCCQSLVLKMGAHPLELLAAVRPQKSSSWMICENNTELPVVHTAVKYKWFPRQSFFFCCVCPTTSWSNLLFVLSFHHEKTRGKQKDKDEHNISAHKRCYKEKDDTNLRGNVSTGNKHSQLRYKLVTSGIYPECYSTFHHWISAKTRI